MEKKQLMRLRVTAQTIKPSIHVGKEGLGPKLFKEIATQLKKTKIVKVRVLGSFEGNRKDIAEEIAQKTDSVVADVRGSTIVLAEDQQGQI